MSIACRHWLSFVIAVPTITLAGVGNPAVAVDGCSSGSVATTSVTGYDYDFNVQGYDPRYYTGPRNLTRTRFAASGTSDGSCDWTIPDGVTTAKVLIVGGGGGGGSDGGGGGGGGGVYYTFDLAVTPGDPVTVAIGGGGAGGAATCSASLCDGASGGTSSLTIGGTVIAAVSGGGGGGGGNRSAPATPTGSFSATGGGGGAGAPDVGQPDTSGGAPPAATTSFNPWWSSYNSGPYLGGPGGGTGGSGGPGISPNAVYTVSGGGGGAQGQPPRTTGRSDGTMAVGAYGMTTNVEADRYTRYGAGGAGLEILTNGGSTSFQSASPESGGTSGFSSAPNGYGGVDQTGGGGGGGYFGGTGGRGGTGSVTIWYYRSVTLTGSTSISVPVGSSTTTTAYTNGGGQFSRVSTSTWTFDDGSGGQVQGISFSSASRTISVDTSTPIGTHSMRLRVTDTVGMSATLAIEVSVQQLAQEPLTFISTPPATGKAGGYTYTAGIAGGSGSGRAVITIDPASSSVCSTTDSGDAITVTFLAPGTCTLLGDRPGDDTYQDATQVTQAITVVDRDAQTTALQFDDTMPFRMDEGDDGFAFTVSGGDGTGSYSVTTTADSVGVCSVTGAAHSFLVTHLGPGLCELDLDREGDPDYLPAATVRTSYRVRGLRSISIDPSTFATDYPWSGEPFDITGLPSLLASEGLPTAGEWHVREESTACTANVVPVIRVTGEGLCVVYATEGDTFSWVESETPDVSFWVLTSLVPTFLEPTQTADGFSVWVPAYDPNWNWTLVTSAGSASIDGSGLITVSGLAAGESATVTVTTSRSGFENGVGTVTGVSLNAALVPAFGSVIRGVDGFAVAVTNHDAGWSWSVSVDVGLVSIDSSGVVTVTGLAAGETATVTLDTVRSGYSLGTNSVSGTSLPSPEPEPEPTPDPEPEPEPTPDPEPEPEPTPDPEPEPTPEPVGDTGQQSAIDQTDDVPPSAMVPLASPVRFLDTRQSGERVGTLNGSGAPIRFTIAGRNGVPAEGASAVAANVTVTASDASDFGGYLTVFPCGSRPDTSTLNFASGATVANAVIAPLSADGDVCIYVYGAAHVLFDVSGWIPASGFSALSAPVRLLDTRPTGTRVGALDGSGDPVELQVAGISGMASQGITAIAMNVTVVDTATNDFGGFVTVYPCGSRPDASNLNFVSGQVVANAVVAPVSADGRVCFHVYGEAHLLADVSGWFGDGFTAMSPARLLDTRSSGRRRGEVDGSGEPVVLSVAGVAGVPRAGVAAVALNVTVADTTAGDYGGFVTVYPCGSPPDASNLNFVSGQVVANAVVAPVSAEGTVCFHVFGTAHLLADVSGWIRDG